MLLVWLSNAEKNAYDTKLWLYTYEVLPLAATETIVYGHRSSVFKNGLIFYRFIVE